MPLRPLSFAVQSARAEAEPRAGRAAPDTPPQRSSHPCVFCGAGSGPWQLAVGPLNDEAVRPDHSPPDSACPLCHLVGHLERPRIDEEAMLVWLPEISQPALNNIVREIHMQLHALGDPLEHGAAPRHDTPERYPLHHARTALADRAGGAAERLGTALPSDLAAALNRLSQAARRHQDALLGGLRLLPLGRFFERSKDVYPDIVGGWLTDAVGRRDGSPSGRPQAGA